MNTKSKFLLFLVIPFLLFAHDKCDRPTAKEIINDFPKYCKFVKTVKVKKAMVGEAVTVELQVKNLSNHHIDQLRIQKETKKGAFLTIGEEVMSCGRLEERQKRTFTYKLIPLTPGPLHIPSSRITQFIMWPLNDNKPIKIPKKAGHSNSVKIEVVPVGISIKHIPVKNKVTVGEKTDVAIEIINSSEYDVESFQVRLDYSRDNFVLKNLPRSGREIKSGQRIILPYSVMPVSEGNKAITVRVKKIKFSEKKNVFFPTWSTSLSEKTVLNVNPLRLSVSMHFQRTKLRLIEKVKAVLTVKNKSTVKIQGFKHSFRGDFSYFRKVSTSKNQDYLLIPPGQTRFIEYNYSVEKAGVVMPEFVAISGLKLNGKWISSGKKSFASSPVPALNITPLYLPGIENPITIACPAVKSYYDLYALKILAICLLVLILIALFRFLLRTVIVEFMFGKMILALLLAAFISQSLLFSLTGFWWFFRSMPPAAPDLAAIFVGSVCLCFIFGLFPVKNLAIGSSISGFVLGVVSISGFTGYKTYQLQGFLNFPVSVSIGLFFLSGWAINLWIFRNQKNERRK